MSEFDAAEIARGVGELYEPLADDKGLALKVEAPAAAPVRGNRELVSQALANLVDNAIKYGAGPRPGEWRERCAAGDRGEGGLGRVTGFCSPSPTPAPAFRRPTARAWSSASCGSSRAARSPGRDSASVSPRRSRTCTAASSSSRTTIPACGTVLSLPRGGPALAAG